MPVDRKIAVQKLTVETYRLRIGELMLRRDELVDSHYPWAERFAMGLPLPSFQRNSVWSQSQEISLIESIWKGYDIGSYMIASSKYVIGGDGETEVFSDTLIDGQQRITSIENYLDGKFKVLGYFWDELTIWDKRLFRGYIFPVTVIKTLDEKELKDTYNRLNFSGTKHNESEKA